MSRYDTHIELVPVEGIGKTHGGVMQFGFKRHIGVSGFQKLINQWLKALLTEEGTDPSDRSYGTGFPLLFGTNVTARSDIQQVIEFSVNKATEDILRYQSDKVVEDENEALSNATVTSIVFSENETRVDTTVNIENQAGRSLRLQIPIRLT